MAQLFLGSDHGGVELRNEVANYVRSLGHEVVAIAGPDSAKDSCDYPDIAVTVCTQVLAHPHAFGILVCGTGQGMAMTANKVEGIRAGVVSDVFSARMIRAHNNAAVLCLGQRVLGIEVAKLLVEAFLSTAFEGGRHERRVAKLDAASVQPR